MLQKKVTRVRRATKVRRKIYEDGKVRLNIHRSLNHIYAQVISADGSQVLAYANSLEKELKNAVEAAKNKKEAAKVIGKAIAERAIAKGVKQVAFDRSGFKYHGRIQALADAARESGLEF